MVVISSYYFKLTKEENGDSKRRIETTRNVFIQEIKGYQKKQFVKLLLHQVKF